MPDLTIQEMRILKETVFKAAEAGDVEAILDSLKDADEQVCKEVLHHRSKKNIRRLTPLMIAALGGHREVVRLLLDVYGVAVDQTGTLVQWYGEEVTALWCVCRDGLVHQEVFELLLERGANINHEDAGGFKTPLIQACKREKVEVIDFLVSRGADVNLPTRTGRTPLIQACHNGHVNLVEKLVSHGAFVNVSYGYGQTPLIHACMSGHLETVEKIVSLGADVNLPNRFGTTPLMKATRRFSSYFDKIVEFLLQQGADPNKQDSRKNTALHYAAQNMSLKVMNLLVDNGAILMKNSQGLTPPLCETDDPWNVTHRFLQHPRIPRQDKVDALEATGALLCLEDLDGGYAFLVEAMEERFSDPGDILSKPLSPPVAALGNIVESQTLEELEARRREPYSLLMECLLILERGLGEVDSYYLGRCHRLVCETLQRLGRSDAILPLSHYLMQRHPKHVSKLLSGACDSTAEMLKGGKTPKFCEMKALLECAMETWQKEGDHNGESNKSKRDSYKQKVESGLRFCEAILHTVGGTAEEKQVAGLVQQLVRVLDGKASTLPFSLLHSAVDSFRDSLHYDVQSETSLCMRLIHMLMDSRACVNAVNEDGNTPLAVLTSFPLSQKPHHSETVKNVVEMLTKAGAHLDCLNGYGWMPLDTGDAEMEAILREYCPLSLKCLASRAILKHKLPYQSCLPEVVQKFVQLHERKPTRHMYDDDDDDYDDDDDNNDDDDDNDEDDDDDDDDDDDGDGDADESLW